MASFPPQTLYIGGRRVDARSGDTFETLNPATGRPICAVQVAGGEDVEIAVRSALDGFAAWSAMTGAERGRILLVDRSGWTEIPLTSDLKPLREGADQPESAQESTTTTTTNIQTIAFMAKT